MANTTTTEAICPVCGSAFERRRKDKVFCSRKCKQTAKDARRKPNRLARDRKREGRDPKLYRNLDDPASATAKFGFTETVGYIAPVRTPTVYFEVSEVIDYDDNFADLLPISHARPAATWVEMPF